MPWVAAAMVSGRGIPQTSHASTNALVAPAIADFHGANRHSLRIETAHSKGSFRIEVSRTHLGITKNPAPGEGLDKVEPLARKALELAPDHWYPVRITFQGSTVTAQVGEVSATATHPIFGEPKEAMNLLVFGEQAVFRNVVVRSNTSNQ